MALLAVACSLLECLVGKDGVMNDYIPSFALRDGLQVGARRAAPPARPTASLPPCLRTQVAALQQHGNRAWRAWCPRALQELLRHAKAQTPSRPQPQPHRNFPQPTSPAAPQFLIFFQHGLLLPCWVIVVLRWGRAL